MIVFNSIDIWIYKLLLAYLLINVHLKYINR